MSLITLFEQYGSIVEVYAVGGCVRDIHLGLTPKDYDYVVVGATPDQMLQCNFKRVGSDFPVFLSGDGTEFALARTERKTSAGYAGFECDTDGVTLEQDLVRRDLTINAMAIRIMPEAVEFEGIDIGRACVNDIPHHLLESVTIDPFNGLQDLRNGLLRHVSSAFAEDPIRALRVARFAARYNFEVSSRTIKLMRKLAQDGEYNSLVAERVYLEISKGLSEPHLDRFFQVLNDGGVSPYLWDGDIDMEAVGVMSTINVSSITIPISYPVIFSLVFFEDQYFRLKDWKRVIPSHVKAFFQSDSIQSPDDLLDENPKVVAHHLMKLWTDFDCFRKEPHQGWLAQIIDLYIATIAISESVQGSTPVSLNIRHHQSWFKAVQRLGFKDLTKDQQSGDVKRIKPLIYELRVKALERLIVNS